MLYVKTERYTIVYHVDPNGGNTKHEAMFELSW